MRNKKRLNRANGLAQNLALGGPLSPLAMVNTWRRGSKNRHMSAVQGCNYQAPRAFDAPTTWGHADATYALVWTESGWRQQG